MAKQRPEQGVEYASEPTDEYRSHNRLEALKSLAVFLNVTEDRALDLLESPAEYRAEIRSRPLSWQEALRRLEARYLPPG
jgi:hypothetical protein